MTLTKNNLQLPQTNTTGYSHHAAYDPAASVFVSANAGAGKTSLLTNRVLALLLHGVPPSKLLCLTYTHAAASEMSNRVLEKLGGWVMADDKELLKQLSALKSETISQQQLIFARSLFAKVLEAPEGLRIQTIHSFCQSLLRRFPLEAEVSPHFSLMDSRTQQALLKEAAQRLLSRAQQGDAQLQASLNAIAYGLNESSFQGLLGEIIANKRRISSLFSGSEAVQRAETALWKLLDIPRRSTLETLAEMHFTYDEDTRTRLQSVCSQLLLAEGKSDQQTGNGLARWLECGTGHSAAREAYIKVYITKDGGKRKTLFTKNTLTKLADAELLQVEQERMHSFLNKLNALETAQRSTHILHIANAFLTLYDGLKNNRALMDYDDLILTARRLLQKPEIAPWVLYKLDGGIDHILVDEAQDTSPEQWDIIEALTQEFFSGVGRQEQERSLFVVGDEKQSIYSFQGADPAALGQKEIVFSARINDVAKTFHKMQLSRSYRSTREILEAVDTIFLQGPARAGLMFGSDVLKHIPTRLEDPGMVELWPLTLPIMQEDKVATSSKTMLARQIADTIRGWLDNGVMLESKGRRVSPGDIMILVRNRTVLVDGLVRALKRRNIPVAGHDRMALGDNLAVQDLIALGQCLLLPEDDLTLAALLKSPICGLNEDHLFSLAWNRSKKSLWEVMREQSEKESHIHEAFTLLSDLRARADYVSPYELYIYLLDTLGIRKRIIGRMGEEYNDAIDEFVGQTMLYERAHTPSMQGFLSWLAAGDSEIKRDMEQARDSIRIMTVHGSKGLQAPIVILPDTVDVPRSRDTLLWYDTGDGALPFWPSSSKHLDAVSASLRDKQKEAMLAEYRRLLYVALTRAEDRLYIAGSAGKNALSDESWYQLAANGLKSVARPVAVGNGEGLRLGNPPAVHRSLPMPGEVPKSSAGLAHDFHFLNRMAAVEPTPSQPLTPSRLALDEPASASPVSHRNINVFQQGNLIHFLLQHLPAVAEGERKTIALRLAKKYRHTVSAEAIDMAISEVMTVMSHPDYGFIFSGEGLSEVPVAGCVNFAGKTVAVAGQIDRLVLRNNEVWIVDYKSNRFPPAHLKNVSVTYIKQMALYRLLLQQIYPDKTIHCALLWTANATITTLDEGLLSSYIQ